MRARRLPVAGLDVVIRLGIHRVTSFSVQLLAEAGQVAATHLPFLQQRAGTKIGALARRDECRELSDHLLELRDPLLQR